MAVFAGFRERAAIFTDFVRSQVIDVCLAGFDNRYRAFIDLFEVVGGIEKPICPFVSQPPNIPHDVRFKLFFFFAGIGVVKPQVAESSKFGSDAKIEANGLRMPNMQVSVGFGREAGVNAAAVSVGL
jgi:hypothetical protein